MRVLVTGGSGFTGSHVVPRLTERGHEVAALARSSSSADILQAMGAELVRGDLDDPASTVTAFKQAHADVLLNIASLGFGYAPTILDATTQAGIGRAVFVSTTSIFTRLPAPSKAVRVAAEDAIRDSGLDWTIIRPTMIYGTPRDRNIARLLRFLQRSPVFPLPGRGDGLQQPIHVADLADVLVESLDVDATVEYTYNVAGPEAIPFRRLVLEAGAAVGRIPALVPVPLGPVAGLVRFYERVVDEPRLKEEQILRLSEDKSFDIAAAKRDLAFDPRPFHFGVRQEAELLR